MWGGSHSLIIDRVYKERLYGVVDTLLVIDRVYNERLYGVVHTL